MFNRVISAAVNGIESKCVLVEADVSDGLPMFSMVGYLASEVREAQDRVRTALRNSGYGRILLEGEMVTIDGNKKKQKTEILIDWEGFGRQDPERYLSGEKSDKQGN